MAKRVVVIDDAPDMRLLIRRVLSQAGLEVEERESAEGLEDALRSTPADLVICDLMLPGRDGLAVCRSLRSGAVIPRTPVLLVSSKAFAGDKRAALSAGAAGYLVKPFSAAELLRATEEALQTQVSARIWGCRGSIAAPDQARGAYGGETACLQLTLPGGQQFIFDAGTGIRRLGNALAPKSPMRLHILLTHYHWDHIQGLPFFKPLYIAGNEIHIHGPGDDRDYLVQAIEGQMGGAFFPVSPESFQSAVTYSPVKDTEFAIAGVSFSAIQVMHPGRTLAYRVELGDRSLVFAPDHEVVPESVEPYLTGEALRVARFCEGAAIVIHDCQYTRAEYERKRGWGHSCGECVGRMLASANVGRILLFHHDPDHDDTEVEAVHREFRQALEAAGGRVPSEPAREGAVLTL